MKIWKYFAVILIATFLLLSFSMSYSRTNAATLSNIVSGADSFIQNGQGDSKIDNEDIHNKEIPETTLKEKNVIRVDNWDAIAEILLNH